MCMFKTVTEVLIIIGGFDYYCVRRNQISTMASKNILILKSVPKGTNEIV